MRAYELMIILMAILMKKPFQATYLTLFLLSKAKMGKLLHQKTLSRGVDVSLLIESIINGKAFMLFLRLLLKQQISIRAIASFVWLIEVK